MPRVVACGGRRSAFDQFCTALGARGQADLAVLLVDAEAPVTQPSPWDHVAHRKDDSWRQPAGATADHLHLMVQCMETWFLADRQALKGFYGNGFQESALPASIQLEEVTKQDVEKGLHNATRKAKTRGAYDKGKHSFKLLALLDPKLILAACPWSERFFSTLDRLLKQQPSPQERRPA